MLHLLGRAELVRDHSDGAGRRVRFLPERRFRLLAYLALRGDWVSRDELATLFWPDRTQEAARSNLRKLLQEARALDLPQLESDRNSVRWIVGTDVVEFKAALERGDTDAAVSLYRGPALPGLDGGESDAFSTWLAGERRRLHSTWREAVVALLPGRDPARALELAELLLADDPFDEDAMIAALDARRALGDSHGAEEAFRSYAERLIEELGVEPSARVRLAAGTTFSASGETAPVPTTASFIGRVRELKELSALLTSPRCRLVTITGPGGIGKSPLVKQAVRQLASSYADGVTWIALDDLTDIAQLAPRIAVELALDLGPQQDPVDRIAEHLSMRHALIVLDNAEHLTRLSALVERLLDAAPRLQVLSTSRARIGARAEWLVPLLGLALPPLDGAANDIVAADAVQLFIAHARASDARFNVSANLTPVTRLVHAVGGMPLAILLAATWVRLLPITDLVSEVTQSLDVLAHAEEGDERPEHRSVRATFEQSWRLLAPQEQRALAALAVMVGAFTLAAARDVAQAPLPLLASLVDKSLVQSDGAGHFALHPLIQQFAAEKLASGSDAEDSARGAHCRHFHQWLRRVSDVPRAGERRAMLEIEQALENLRAMWRHAIAIQAWEVVADGAVPLMRFFELRSRWSEGAALLDEADVALALRPAGNGAPDRARANVWRAQSTLDFRSGANERCIQRAARSLALCHTLGIRKGVKANLNNLGLAAWHLNQRDEAADRFAEAIQEARADGDVEGEAMFLGNAALVEKAKGDLATALVLTERALAVHRARNNDVSVRVTLNNLGNLLRALQRPRDALAVLNEALATMSESDLSSTRAFVLCNLALAYDDLEEFNQALPYAEQALGFLGSQGEPALETSIRHALARACTGLGRFDEAQRHLARAVALALAQHRTSVAVGTLMHWGCWHAARGHHVRAAALLVFAATHATTDGPDRHVAERSLLALSKSLGTEALARASSEGQMLTVEQLAAELVASARQPGQRPYPF